MESVVIIYQQALALGQHSHHVFLHLWDDHAWAGDIVAVLGGVGDRPALLGTQCIDLFLIAFPSHC